MHVVPTHLIETVLHYEGERVSVSAMNHLRVLEWVIDPCEQFLSLYCGHGVTLDCTNEPHSVLFQDLKALLIIVVDNILHIFQTNSDLLHGSMIEQVFHQDVSV